MRPIYKAVLNGSGSYEKQLELWGNPKKTFSNGYKTYTDYTEKTWFKGFRDPAFLRWALYHRQLCVKSFTKLDVEYTLDVDAVQGIVLNCNCDDFIKRGRSCKLMYLIDRMYDRFQIECPRRPEVPRFKEANTIGNSESMCNTDEIVDRDDLSAPILGHFPLVQEALTASRYRIEKEKCETRAMELKKAKFASTAEFRLYLVKAA
ncbi:hypothetical protein FBU30_011262 [Linnemannia zychae]|nr:hypothetical protein FBU30_011262 [Linnemannia zychae]